MIPTKRVGGWRRKLQGKQDGEKMARVEAIGRDSCGKGCKG